MLQLERNGHVSKQTAPWGSKDGVTDTPGFMADRSRTKAFSIDSTQGLIAVASATKLSPVITGLRRLLKAGAIDNSEYLDRRAAYIAARSTATKLSGTRRAELLAVIANIEEIARRGSLSADRLRPLWLTLERNVEWWTTGPLPKYGQRVSFAGSELIWQYYSGQGFQFQVLANFGKLNGLWQGGRKYNARMTKMIDELLPLAVRRGKGWAWEYYFRFGGGRPPWVSAMAQATGLQALARASQRLQLPQPLTMARRGLALFDARPPSGVTVPTAGGSHYLLYSFDSKLFVLNGFLQSLVGLYDYAELTESPKAKALFRRGDKEARRAVPTFDTGAWSMYSHGSVAHESDLSYHKLVTGFLKNLCKRTESSVYCDAESRFTRYLREKPRLSVQTRRVRAKSGATVRFRLSKISSVSIVIRDVDKNKTVSTRSLGTLAYGNRTFGWKVPKYSGNYAVTIAATDLAANKNTTTQAVQVLKARKP